MKKIFVAALIVLSSILYSQPSMDYWDYDYDPGYYQVLDDPEYVGPDSRYQGENWPSRPFFIGTVETSVREPRFGYPMCRKVQKGVSDTVEVIVKLRNQTGVDYILGTGEYPQDWIVPKLFDPRADVKKERPRLDTNYFDYTFFSWWTTSRFKWSQPTSIDTMGGMMKHSGPRNSDLMMQYYLWNIPPGTYRVIMEVTEAAPTGFKMMNGWGPEIIIIDSAKTMADTINAWVACYWRAYWNRDSTAAMAWVDTILTYNPKSIAGYRLVAEMMVMNPQRKFLGDSLYAMQALDSVKKFIEYYEDPALPDSANLNSLQRAWMNMVKLGAQSFQNQVRNPQPIMWRRL